MMDLKGDDVDCGGVEHVWTKNRLVNVLMKVLSFSSINLVNLYMNWVYCFKYILHTPPTVVCLFVKVLARMLMCVKRRHLYHILL